MRRTLTPTAPRTTAMPTDTSAAALLRLMWLASPALPVGGFSYSEGLEAAVESGRVSDENTAAAWLVLQLQINLARSDLPVATQAHGAWAQRDLARIEHLNAWVRQTRESAELRQQAEQMGRSLAEWLKNSEWAGDTRIAQLTTLAPAPTWPLAFALATLLAGAPARDALLAMAFSWAENVAQAAIKAVPLGQAAAQRMLLQLADAIPAAVEHALALGDGERQAFAPMLAILSAQHETQYSRLFRS
jgi:urease accessory protein